MHRRRCLYGEKVEEEKLAAGAPRGLAFARRARVPPAAPSRST